jgi:hypothetical protein
VLGHEVEEVVGRHVECLLECGVDSCGDRLAVRARAVAGDGDAGEWHGDAPCLDTLKMGADDAYEDLIVLIIYF